MEYEYIYAICFTNPENNKTKHIYFLNAVDTHFAFNLQDCFDLKIKYLRVSRMSKEYITAKRNSSIK